MKKFGFELFFRFGFFKIAYISKVKIESLPGGSNYKKNFK